MGDLRGPCRALATLLVAAAAVLPGCGDDDPGTVVSPEVLRTAAAATSEAGGARATFEATVKVGRHEFPMTGEGVFEGDSSRMTLDMTEFMRKAAETGSEEFGDPEGWSGEGVSIGSLFWMRMPALQEMLQADEPWIRYELSKPQPAGFEGPGLYNRETGTPNRILNFLRASGDGVVELGQERVRGEQTTRYRGTIELRRLPDVVAPQERELARKEAEQAIEELGREDLPTHVWIAGDGRIRRIDTNFTAKPEGVEAEVDSRMELFDFGTAVSIRPPPEDQVIDWVDVVAKLQG